MTESSLRSLAAIEQLIVASATHNDRRHWAELAGLYTPTAVLVRPNGEPVEGRDAIEVSYGSRPSNRRTRHVCSNIAVTFEPGDEPVRASATTSVLLFSWETNGGDELPSAVGPIIGDFTDEVERQPDGWWLIARRVATLAAKADQ
jgi:ketosteroid isomerase-like protein